MHIKKGDIVQVVVGEDSGKRGKVLIAYPKKHKLIVEGINYISRHTKKSQKNPNGGILQKEAPVQISNVVLFSPHVQAPTSVVYKYEVQEKRKTQGKAKKVKVRYCKKSDRPL